MTCIRVLLCDVGCLRSVVSQFNPPINIFLHYQIMSANGLKSYLETHATKQTMTGMLSMAVSRSARDEKAKAHCSKFGAKIKSVCNILHVSYMSCNANVGQAGVCQKCQNMPFCWLWWKWWWWHAGINILEPIVAGARLVGIGAIFFE